MNTIVAYEAKTHLSQLLDRVAKGERIIISKHGIPVAILQPIDTYKRKPARETIAEIKRFRSAHRLDGLTIRELIAEGRR